MKKRFDIVDFIFVSLIMISFGHGIGSYAQMRKDQRLVEDSIKEPKYQPLPVMYLTNSSGIFIRIYP